MYVLSHVHVDWLFWIQLCMSRYLVMLYVYEYINMLSECSFEKCWGRAGKLGGGHPNVVLDIWGGHVNSACVAKSPRRYIFK